MITICQLRLQTSKDRLSINANKIKKFAMARLSIKKLAVWKIRDGN